MAEEKKTKVEKPNIMKTTRLDQKIIESERFNRLDEKSRNFEQPELNGRKTKIKNKKSENQKKEEHEESKQENDVVINIINKEQDKQKNQNENKEQKINNNINNSRNHVRSSSENDDAKSNIEFIPKGQSNNEKKNKEPEIKLEDSPKLKYSKSVFYIILFLNIFLPGIGTIIAAIGWGKSSNSSNLKDRTKELIIRGIIQFFTFFIIVGWIQAITDACHYFEIKSY